MQTSLDNTTTGQNDDLAAQLLHALTRRNRAHALALLEQGADAHALVRASEASLERITPTAYALSHMILEVLPAFLGSGRTTVPVAREQENGKRTTIWDEVAMGAWNRNLTVNLAHDALMNCFDCEAPEVAHAMWDAATHALGDPGTGWQPTAERLDCAKRLLQGGAYPRDPASYPALLGTIIEYEGSNIEVPGIPLIRYFGDNDIQTHLNWLEHGLDIDAPINGMPPMHHAVVNNDEGMLAFYLAAGADTKATCTLEALRTNVGALDSEQYVSDAGVTAHDIAREFGHSRLVQMIEAHNAKKRVDAIFSQARKRYFL